MTFEEFFHNHAWCGEAKQQTKDAWDKGAAEKEKEMLRFSKWWHVAPFGLFVTTEEAFEHWKAKVKKEGE